MKYTELAIRVLQFITNAEGKHAGLASALSVQELASGISNDKEMATPRVVNMAMQELADAGLIQTEYLRSGLEQYAIEYSQLDVTGSGLRFLESLGYQAAAEGKKEPWLWSMVSRAANIAQLISLVIQAAVRG